MSGREKLGGKPPRKLGDALAEAGPSSVITVRDPRFGVDVECDLSAWAGDDPESYVVFVFSYWWKGPHGGRETAEST
jgi:hypothetical protein